MKRYENQSISTKMKRVPLKQQQRKQVIFIAHLSGTFAMRLTLHSVKLAVHSAVNCRYECCTVGPNEFLIRVKQFSGACFVTLLT